MKRFLILALTAVAYAAGSLIPFEPSKDADGCYVISTANELYGFADIVNASKTHDECGKLSRNIVVNKRNQDEGFSDWVPIQIFSGTFAASPWAIRTQCRMVEISGLQAGEKYALMDLQGRLLQRGCANGLTVMLLVAQFGRYLLRVAGRNRIVNVR